jgi:hypothetical protein
MTENLTDRIAPPADGLVVDVTSDLICPWCFVAKRRLEKASSILGKTLGQLSGRGGECFA